MLLLLLLRDEAIAEEESRLVLGVVKWCSSPLLPPRLTAAAGGIEWALHGLHKQLFSAERDMCRRRPPFMAVVVVVVVVVSWV